MFAAVTGRARAQQTGKVHRIAFASPTVPVTRLLAGALSGAPPFYVTFYDGDRPLGASR
jgi:hypothetical protein